MSMAVRDLPVELSTIVVGLTLTTAVAWTLHASPRLLRLDGEALAIHGALLMALALSIRYWLPDLD